MSLSGSGISITTGVSSGGTNEVSTKRSLSEALYGGHKSSPSLQSRFIGIGDIDWSEFSQSPDDLAAKKNYKVITLEGFRKGGLCLLPIEDPSDSLYTMTYFANTYYSVWILDADFSDSGGGILLSLLGLEPDAPLPSTWCIGQGIRLDDLPQKFIVPRPGSSGVPTGVEKVVTKILIAAKQTTLGMSGGSSSSGASSDNAPVVKKLAGCVVVDWVGNIRPMRSKEGAEKKMERLAGPMRELREDRLNLMCPNFNFDVERVWAECARHKGRVMASIDPMQSLSRLYEVLHLPVCTDIKKFEAWFLGTWQHRDFTFNLTHFLPGGNTGWHSDFDYEGRRNLLMACEGWVNFQRIFKGEAFVELYELFDDPSQPLSVYHTSYTYNQIETMVRSYFYEICTTQGTVSKVYCPGEPIVTQADCVALLKLLVKNLVQEVREDKWEREPHSRFYSTTYTEIRHWPLFGTTSGPASGAVPAVRPLPTPLPHCHKHGLCFWYLAGILGVRNERNRRLYECRDKTNPHHVAPRLVKVKIVQELLDDPDFMGCCQKAELKQRVQEAFKKQQKLFGK